ncbi:chaperonin-like RbcX protein 2, chloroplastic [Silene latifolia]|uniref:chaperonin-like RbcX protein 2, chloroplastic n=1 Tax=Silene latifolia TaxID=37657 RepID=UPI003D784B26
MVGAFSLLGSPVIDSPNSCPCLCLDAMSSSGMNLKGGKKKSRRRNVGSLELGSSFVDQGKELLSVMNMRCSKKQRKARSFVIVNELGGQYEDTFEDVKTQMLNYFTYKAVRTVLNQLYEMNPPKYTWLYNFLVANKPGDGKLFLRKLGKEKQDLAERVMVTRLNLYGRWIKKCNHGEIYQFISDENLELMRERLLETIVWPSDDTNTEKIG